MGKCVKYTNSMEYILNFFRSLDAMQITAATFFLIAIIDPLGNMPMTINMEKQGVKINPLAVCAASAVILLAFLLHFLCTPVREPSLP